MDIQGSKAIFVGGASGMCLATAKAFQSRGGNRAVGGTPQRTVKKDGTRHSTETFAKVPELNNEPNAKGERLHPVCSTPDSPLAYPLRAHTT